MLARNVSMPVMVLVLWASAGCVDGSSGWEPGISRSTLEPDFEDVALCPETDDWGAWSQTPLSTWDPDVRPVIEWIIDQTGISSTTYVGHDPSIGRAADWRPRSREEGTRLADWLQDHITGEAAPLGLYYVMWQAQIGFSDEIRDVEDRGSVTANHCDHVHMSFYDTVDFRPGDIAPWDDAPEPDAGPPPEDAGVPPEDADVDGGGDADEVTDAPAPVDDADPTQRTDGGAEGDTGDAPPCGLVGGCGALPSRGRAPWAPILLDLVQ